MDPLTILATASAFTAFIKQAMPIVKEALEGGKIPVEKQAEARAQYESLRQAAGGEYTGSHWELSGR